MSWKDQYKFGTLLLLPPADVSASVNALRARYDPDSQKICPAHITLTQPLLEEPDENHIEKLKTLASEISGFAIEYGPIEKFGERCITFNIKQQKEIIDMREYFHNTGYFNLSLPYTDGFVPHMTISERGIENSEMVIPELNISNPGGMFQCTEIAYMVPNSEFKFEVKNVLSLRVS